MNIRYKIYSTVSFLVYFFRSKTKYKIHSPFVFNFINKVLESDIQNSNTTKLINFYKTQYKYINYSKNAGAGSTILSKANEPTLKFIQKVSIPKKYGKILMLLSQQFEHKTIIELGTSLGVSTSYLSNSLNTIITIESNNDIFNIVKNAFEKLNFNNVHLINNTFENELQKVLENNKDIALIFIDGNHNKQATINYFKAFLPYISKDSVVILDDIYWSKGMTEAWHEIRQYKEVKLSIDLYRIGILFFRKEQKEQEHFTLWY